MDGDPLHTTITSGEAEKLGNEIAEMAAHIDAATHRLLTAIREFDEGGGWVFAGALSCAHWLSWRVGLDLVTAREKVRVARALGKLPAIDDALRRGVVSYAKVRAMTRIATPEMQDKLLNLAHHGTGAQLERIVRGYRSVAPTEKLPPELAGTERTVRTFTLADGMVRFEAVLHADEVGLVMKALEAACSALRTGQVRGPGSHDSAEAPSRLGSHDSPEACSTRGSHDSAEASAPPESPRPTRADALVAVAESFLTNGLAGGTGGDRFEILVHLDQDALGADGQMSCTLEDGTQLSAEAFRRVACDASLVGVAVDDDGKPLDVGRRTRSVPPAIRRALHVRDRGCSFPSCRNKIVDAHHIEHWIHGGDTSLENLSSLCKRHHRLVHEGGWTIEKGPAGELRFLRPDGTPLERAPIEVGATEVDRLIDRHASEGLPIDEWSLVARGDFVPVDYSACVEDLLR